MILFESIKSSLAIKNLLHFQATPLVVHDALRPGGAFVGLFVNLMFDCVFGGTVAFALIKLTAVFGEGVLTYIEHVCC